jgi:hypothetical protein
MESEHLKVYCGIDWAEKHHDVALVDANGRLVAKRRIKESVEGFAELTAMLAEAGDTAQNPIPVAIETPRGLLVAALRVTSRRVYPINPMAVARYRERHSVSRKKSDHVDAMTLANILRTDMHAHRPLPADTELARAIAVLARAHQDATWRRTKATNELRSLLREYYPGFLSAFADGNTTNLASNDARAVLAIAPTPAAAAKFDQSTHQRGAAPRRTQAWSRPAGSQAPRGLALAPTAPGSPRRGSAGRPGRAVAGHPGHRMRQRHSARRGYRRGVRTAPRLPDHHELHRPGRPHRRSGARRDRRRPRPLRGRALVEGLRRFRSRDQGLRPKPVRHPPAGEEQSPGRRRLGMGVRAANAVPIVRNDPIPNMPPVCGEGSTVPSLDQASMTRIGSFESH